VLFAVKLHEEKVEEPACPGEQPELEVIREKKEEKAKRAPLRKRIKMRPRPAKGGSASGGKRR